MNRLSPKARVFVKVFNWKTPYTLEAWTDIQDFFGLQRCEPDYFRNAVCHPPKAPFRTVPRRGSRTFRGLLRCILAEDWALRRAPRDCSWDPPTKFHRETRWKILRSAGTRH